MRPPTEGKLSVAAATDIAMEKRKKLQDEARAIGVSEEYISVLVDEFYTKVRADAELGPVFDHVILDRWPWHLNRMKDFWNSIALRTGTYRGNPMIAHQALTEGKPEHFDIWLRLWKQTLEETAPNPEVVEFFMGYANAMGDRLSRAMFS